MPCSGRRIDLRSAIKSAGHGIVFFMHKNFKKSIDQWSFL